MAVRSSSAVLLLAPFPIVTPSALFRTSKEGFQVVAEFAKIVFHGTR